MIVVDSSWELLKECRAVGVNHCEGWVGFSFGWWKGEKQIRTLSKGGHYIPSWKPFIGAGQKEKGSGQTSHSWCFKCVGVLRNTLTDVIPKVYIATKLMQSWKRSIQTVNLRKISKIGEQNIYLQKSRYDEGVVFVLPVLDPVCTWLLTGYNTVWSPRALWKQLTLSYILSNIQQRPIMPFRLVSLAFTNNKLASANHTKDLFVTMEG